MRTPAKITETEDSLSAKKILHPLYLKAVCWNVQKRIHFLLKNLATRLNLPQLYVPLVGPTEMLNQAVVLQLLKQLSSKKLFRTSLHETYQNRTWELQWTQDETREETCTKYRANLKNNNSTVLCPMDTAYLNKYPMELPE